MKNLDVFIVRFLPFVLFITFGFTLYNAWLGIDDYPFNLLHSQSAVYAISLFLISLSNKRYHCVWNRAMYIYLVLVPIINYIDAICDLLPDANFYLRIYYSSYVLVAIFTAFMAARHFYRVMRSRYRRINDGK